MAMEKWKFHAGISLLLFSETQKRVSEGYPKDKGWYKLKRKKTMTPEQMTRLRSSSLFLENFRKKAENKCRDLSGQLHW
jgi:hypothetical protein